MKWQPIETLPNDTEVLLWSGKQPYFGWRGRFSNNLKVWGWHPNQDWDQSWSRPTHWAELPTPYPPVQSVGERNALVATPL